MSQAGGVKNCTEALRQYRNIGRKIRLYVVYAVPAECSDFVVLHKQGRHDVLAEESGRCYFRVRVRHSEPIAVEAEAVGVWLRRLLTVDWRLTFSDM